MDQHQILQQANLHFEAKKEHLVVQQITTAQRDGRMKDYHLSLSNILLKHVKKQI